jgi:outer membrane protein assembly factor BamB
MASDPIASLRAVFKWIAAGVALLAVLGGVGYYLYTEENEPIEKRGSATEEFVTTEPEEPKPPPKKENPRPWPTYSYDHQRRHISPYDHRPPYRRLWTIDAHDTLEFPPTVGYGRVYLAQQKGLFFALDAETGRVDWRKSLGRCAAASPTVGKKVVYVSYMHPVECLQGQAGADGFVVAWDAETGREKWRFNSAPIESSPLLKGNRLFVGSWDHGVYALNANNGKRIWRFGADNEVNTSAAYWRGRIFIASDSGTIYSLSAKTGKLLWSEGSAREFYYATPTLAHGRVYIGSTDGTMYVFGAKTGRLLWARPLGTYIYGAAAVYKRKVFVGTYDGQFYALDAATGDVVWQKDAGGTVHAAPTVMDGLVYYAICSTCGSEAQRAVAGGTDAVYAVRAKDGKRVWRFMNGGKYANPVVADDDRVYITGRSFQFAFAEKGSPTARTDAKRDRRMARRERERAREARRENRREQRTSRREQR